MKPNVNSVWLKAIIPQTSVELSVSRDYELGEPLLTPALSCSLRLFSQQLAKGFRIACDTITRIECDFG